MSGAGLYREAGNGRKHGFAETVSRLWYNNQNVVYLNLFVVALFGVLGSLAYDLIAVLDQTVSKFAPLGTLLAYIGICMAILFFAMQHGYSMFQLQLSMGRTRKGFFLEQLAVRAVLLLVMQLMAYGLYRLELWKFRTFYPEREAGHLVYDLAVLFTPRMVCLITLLGLAVSMLLIALALRFGVMANIVLVGGVLDLGLTHKQGGASRGLSRRTNYERKFPAARDGRARSDHGRDPHGSVGDDAAAGGAVRRLRSQLVTLSLLRQLKRRFHVFYLGSGETVFHR